MYGWRPKSNTRMLQTTLSFSRSLFCTTSFSLFVWIWYRSEQIFFFVKYTYIFIVPADFFLLFATAELYSKAAIIYARSSLSSLRLDKRHFFCSAGASHCVCVYKYIYLSLDEQNQLKFSAQQKKKPHTYTFIYRKSAVRSLFILEMCSPICCSQKHKNWLVHCFSIFCFRFSTRYVSL